MDSNIKTLEYTGFYVERKSKALVPHDQDRENKTEIDGESEQESDNEEEKHEILLGKRLTRSAA